MAEDEDKIELSRETIGDLGEPRATDNPLSTVEVLCGDPVLPTPVFTGTIVTEGDCHPHHHHPGDDAPGDPVEKVEVVEIIEEIELREEP